VRQPVRTLRSTSRKRSSNDTEVTADRDNPGIDVENDESTDNDELEEDGDETKKKKKQNAQRW
jgi:hypothetical protein